MNSFEKVLRLLKCGDVTRIWHLSRHKWFWRLLPAALDGRNGWCRRLRNALWLDWWGSWPQHV